MKKLIALSLFCIFLLSSYSFAETEITLLSSKKHQVGVRLGTWSNNGGTHPETAVDSSSIPPTDSLIMSIQDVNFFLEGYYAYNLLSNFYTEISLGMVNRGNIQFLHGNLQDFSNILIYPVLLQVKYYPFLSSSNKFQPFVGAGGGLYFGKQDIQFTNDIYAQYYQIQGESETDFNYTLTGGFDWKFNNTFSLDFQTKYMPITFSDYFIGVKDYSATTITIGFKYNYNSNK